MAQTGHKESSLVLGLGNDRTSRDWVSTYHPPGSGHFMLFLVAISREQSRPTGQLPDEDQNIRSQRC